MADSRSLSGRGVGKRNKTWASKNATWGFAGRWHYFATPTDRDPLRRRRGDAVGVGKQKRNRAAPPERGTTRSR